MRQKPGAIAWSVSGQMGSDFSQENYLCITTASYSSHLFSFSIFAILRVWRDGWRRLPCAERRTHKGIVLFGGFPSVVWTRDGMAQWHCFKHILTCFFSIGSLKQNIRACWEFCKANAKSSYHVSNQCYPGTPGALIPLYKLLHVLCAIPDDVWIRLTHTHTISHTYTMFLKLVLICFQFHTLNRGNSRGKSMMAFFFRCNI